VIVGKAPARTVSAVDPATRHGYGHSQYGDRRPAAPARAAAPVPVLYGFGTNQFGELGNGTTSAERSLSPTPAAGLPGTIRSSRRACTPAPRC
jgi:hypothetical protein